MLNKTNLLNLCKIAKSKNEPLFGDVATLSAFPFMSEYVANYQKFDRNTMVTRGFFEPIWNLQYEDNEEGVLESFRDDVELLLFKNKTNYEKLYAITLAEYNPLENYKMVESGKDTTTGSDNQTDAFGAQTKTNEFGASSESTEYGADTTTQNYGAVSTTDNIGGGTDTLQTGSQTKTLAEAVAGFNSSNYNNSQKNTETNGERTDTSTTGARTNQHSENERVDSATRNAHTDTRTAQAKTDTETLSSKSDSHDKTFNSETNHNFTRSGNIGVTTSQQMAQSEIDLWTAFKFFDRIVDDIIVELCGYSDEGGCEYGF